MGCFSFICQKSGEAALSSSFDGDQVHLFLLEKGVVIEEMHGNYDSYGRVFKSNGDSFEWQMDWGDVCDLMFDEDDSNGIALILGPYWKEGDPCPTKRSENDPNQGWGEHGVLMGSVSKAIAEPFENPYHSVK